MSEGGAEVPERQRRDERMRYEVLQMLHRAAGGDSSEIVNAWAFAVDLGVWHAEVFRVVEWLERAGLVRYHGVGPAISITPRGIEYLASERNRRRTIRDQDWDWLNN